MPDVDSAAAARPNTRSCGKPPAIWRFLGILVFLLPPALLAVMGFQRRWVSDDAFINLRVVQNLLDGYGPVFNVGERVEVYTNPLWVAVLSIWGGLGGTLEIGAVGLGLTFAVLGLLAAQAAGVRLSSLVDDSSLAAARRLALPVGAIIFAALPAAWDFATSGLETGLGFAWLGLSYWLLVGCAVRPSVPSGRRRLRDRMATATVLGLGPLIRPDFAIFSAAFLSVLLINEAIAAVRDGRAGGWSLRIRRSGMLFAALLACAALIPATYQLFRMGYFAALVPNTALAKEAGAANWSQGWLYLRDFEGAYALALPLVVLLAWWATRLVRTGRHGNWMGAALLIAPVLAAAFHAFYIVRVGGDFMHARMLLPSLFAALLPMATVVLRVEVRRLPEAGLQALACAVIFAWALVCALTLRVPYEAEISPDGIADERGYYADWAGRPNPVRLDDYADTEPFEDGRMLRTRVEKNPGTRLLVLDVERFPGTVEGYEDGVAVLDPDTPAEVSLVTAYQQAGIFSYVAGPRVHVVDRFALADPIASRMSLGSDRGRPGHEKVFSNVWIIARFAEIVPEAPGEVHAARAALRCDDLAKLNHAVTDSMSVRRFVSNVGLAWRLNKLRVPSDPQEARARFCDETIPP